MGAKLTIEEMQALAKAHDGVCLSTKYVDNRTKLRWRCAEGHEWEATPSNVKQHSWCPACGGALRGTIEQMQALAQAQKGVCLSKRYGGANSKLRWRCAEGHEWKATPAGVKNRNSWCPVCVRKLQGPPRLTIEQMQVLAKRHGSQCLSTKYVNTKTKLRWRCREGHEWEATPGNMKHRVQRGNWCLKCPRVAQRPAPA